MDYYKVHIELNELHPWRDLLIYELGELLFESFEDTENGLDAYVQSSDFNEPALKELAVKFEDQFVSISHEFIEAQNWNAAWESNFEPVKLENKLIIKAPFHNVEESFDYTIEIQPKMSFGTGHHQTTQLISAYLLERNPMPSRVLDMGCGTGVLAILAKMRGANEVLGIDIEDWAYENSIENAQRNGITDIQFECGGVEKIPNVKFGLILANINKNILLQQMERYAEVLENEGDLILSGFYKSDVEDLVTFGDKCGFKYVQEKNIDNWAMLNLRKI